MRLLAVVACSLVLAAPALADAKPDSGDIHVRAHFGARVYVDGHLAGVSLGEKLGVTVQNLPAGTHAIRLTRSGHGPKELRVTVQPATTTDVTMGDLNIQPRIEVRPREEPVDMTPGSPPMTVDDTGTPGTGNWEINSSLESDRARGHDSYQLPSFDINYGAAEDVQLTFEVPWVVIREPGGEPGAPVQRAHSIGNTSLGLKYRFYSQDASGLSLAVFPHLNFHTPGESRGVEEPASWLLPILLTRDFTAASITANASVEKSTDESHANLAAILGAGTRLSERLAALGELSAQDLSSSDALRVTLRMGLRAKIDESQVIFGMVGIDLKSGADGLRHRYLSIGYQRLLDRKDR